MHLVGWHWSICTLVGLDFNQLVHITEFKSISHNLGIFPCLCSFDRIIMPRLFVHISLPEILVQHETNVLASAHDWIKHLAKFGTKSSSLRATGGIFASFYPSFHEIWSNFSEPDVEHGSTHMKFQANNALSYYEKHSRSPKNRDGAAEMREQCHNLER